MRHTVTVYKGEGKSYYGKCSCGWKTGACKIRKTARAAAADHRLNSGVLGKFRR